MVARSSFGVAMVKILSKEMSFLGSNPMTLHWDNATTLHIA